MLLPHTYLAHVLSIKLLDNNATRNTEGGAGGLGGSCWGEITDMNPLRAFPMPPPPHLDNKCWLVQKEKGTLGSGRGVISAAT